MFGILWGLATIGTYAIVKETIEKIKDKKTDK